MNKIAKSTIFIMLATIISKILGFAKEIILASTYGASMYSDAYIVSANIPQVIFSSIGVALSTIFIPLYLDIKINSSEDEANKFTNNIFNIVIIMCTLLSLFGVIFTKDLIKLFAIGFRGETLKIAIDFTRILMLGLVFTGMSYILTSYLQIKNNFIIPALINVPRNIIIILSMLLSIKYGPYIMVWGTLLGVISEFIFQIPFSTKIGYKYKSYINLKEKYIKKIILLLGPVLIGVAVNQINNMIDRTLASTLGEGAISALNYSHKLIAFIMALFITSIATVIYPMLAELSSKSNAIKFSNTITKSINMVIILILPISIGAIVLCRPIVQILFERGEFDNIATSMTAIALSMYSLGMVAFGLREVLNKVFYSLKDTKTPMINGIISMIINIILNIIIKQFKLGGLAIATSISALICNILLFTSLSKKIGYFGQDKIIKTTIKCIIASILMGIVTSITYSFFVEALDNQFIYQLLSLIISVFVGCIIYIIIIYLFRIEEVKLIIHNLNKLKIKKVICD